MKSLVESIMESSSLWTKVSKKALINWPKMAAELERMFDDKDGDLCRALYDELSIAKTDKYLGQGNNEYRDKLTTYDLMRGIVKRLVRKEFNEDEVIDKIDYIVKSAKLKYDPWEEE